MSEQPSAPETGGETNGEHSEGQEPQQEPKPTETVEFWKAKAREQEKRAKANAAAQAKLDELEKANQTELEKATSRATEAEAERDRARAETLRYRIATRHGISDEDAELFLTGTDEDTLTKQAERLSDRESERKKNGNHVPREGASSSTASSNEDERAAVRTLFGGG